MSNQEKPEYPRSMITYGNKTWIFKDKKHGPEVEGYLDQEEEYHEIEMGDEIEFQEAYNDYQEEKRLDHLYPDR